MMWLLLNVKLSPGRGPPAVPCPQLDCFSVQLKGVYLQALLGIHAIGSGRAPKEKSSVRGAQIVTEKNLLGNGTILFRGFLPSQPWLASQPTSALVCIALYLLYIDKYIEIGTIYDSETFTHMVLHAFTVSYGILKSHYLQ